MNRRAVSSCFKMLAVIGIIFSSCKPDNLKEGAVKEYFDVKGYFEQNIAQLNKKHGKVNKTVVHSGSAESKTVAISNWQSELSLFTESDINKPAWKGNYVKTDSAGTLIYRTTNPDLRTREIIVSKTKQGVIQKILIRNEVNNLLYTTRETLAYFPDSAYEIDKYQKVKLLKANTYKIAAKFN